MRVMLLHEVPGYIDEQNEISAASFGFLLEEELTTSRLPALKLFYGDERCCRTTDKIVVCCFKPETENRISAHIEGTHNEHVYLKGQDRVDITSRGVRIQGDYNINFYELPEIKQIVFTEEGVYD